MFFLTFPLIATMAGIHANNILDLMEAIENWDINKVKELLHTVDVESKHIGRNVLHAAAHSNGEITRLLISQGAGRVVNDHDLDGMVSPLLHACFVMNRQEYLPHMYEIIEAPQMYEIIEAMLKAGGDPNVSDSALCTPLHYVTTGPEARLLISYGANVNAKDHEGNTPASKYFTSPFGIKHDDFIYALADGKADFTIANDFGDTIFHLQSDSIPWTKELVTFLARNGVPLDAVNNRGETALTKILKRHLYLYSFGMAPKSMSYENLNYSFYAHMAEAGANLNAPNKRGETLLILAVLKYCAGMAKWLLENGAHVEAKNSYGDPPLLALIKQEKWNYEGSDYSDPCKYKTDKIKAVVEVLVKGGADVEFIDKAGHNAAHYLRESRITWLALPTTLDQTSCRGEECPETRVEDPEGSVKSYMHRV